MKTVAILLLLCSSAMAQYRCGCEMCSPWLYQRRTFTVLSPQTPTRIQNSAASTPAKVADDALALLELTRDDLLLDPGCGDGQLLITACRRYGCRGIGIEIDAGRAQLARENVRLAEMADRIDIYRGDSRKCWLGNPTAAYLYLPQDTARTVADRLTCRLVSYSHPVDGATTVLADGHPVYVRAKPAPLVQWVPLNSRSKWVALPQEHG